MSVFVAFNYHAFFQIVNYNLKFREGEILLTKNKIFYIILQF